VLPAKDGFDIRFLDASALSFLVVEILDAIRSCCRGWSGCGSGRPGALVGELGSTMALAHLLSEDGQRDQARHMLASVYDRFTEGFVTADLKLAHALLEDLR
jgi:hypothetical protein